MRVRGGKKREMNGKEKYGEEKWDEKDRGVDRERKSDKEIVREREKKNERK